MRELNNLENDPDALAAVGAEILEFIESTRYLLIPSSERLTDSVILLRRLVRISHRVLPIKSYFNLLRDLQRIALTGRMLAEAAVKDMPASNAAQVAAKKDAFEQHLARVRALLVAHPVGEVEGKDIAASVRHQLCTEDVFCAACAFLQLEVSRRGSIYYITGESPEFLETKKNSTKTRDPLAIDNEVTLKMLASNLARPDAERGTVEQTQITNGFNLLAKQYQLFVQMPAVVRWLKEGEHLAQARRMVDVREHFGLTLREYTTTMAMARQMGLSTLKPKRASSGNKYTLNQKIEERVLMEAERRGYTPNRTLNVMLADFFMLIDARQREKKSQGSVTAGHTKKTGIKHGKATGRGRHP